MPDKIGIEIQSAQARRKLNEAKQTLVHYLRMSAEGEWHYDHDNQQEIEQLVEDIFEAAVTEATKRITKLLVDLPRGTWIK